MTKIEFVPTKTALVVIDLQKGVVGLPLEPRSSSEGGAYEHAITRVFPRIGRVRSTAQILADLG